MNGVVLYASVAQSGLARVGPPWFLLLGRFRDHGVSFGDGFVALGPQPGIPDGPRVAGDGALALLAWTETSLDRWDRRWDRSTHRRHRGRRHLRGAGHLCFNPRRQAAAPEACRTQR